MPQLLRHTAALCQCHGYATAVTRHTAALCQCHGYATAVKTHGEVCQCVTAITTHGSAVPVCHGYATAVTTHGGASNLSQAAREQQTSKPGQGQLLSACDPCTGQPMGSCSPHTGMGSSAAAKRQRDWLHVWDAYRPTVNNKAKEHEQYRSSNDYSTDISYIYTYVFNGQNFKLGNFSKDRIKTIVLCSDRHVDCITIYRSEIRNPYKAGSNINNTAVCLFGNMHLTNVLHKPLKCAFMQTKTVYIVHM